MNYIEDKEDYFNISTEAFSKSKEEKKDYISIHQNASLDSDDYDQYKKHIVKRRTLTYKFNDVS